MVEHACGGDRCPAWIPPENLQTEREWSSKLGYQWTELGDLEEYAAPGKRSLQTELINLIKIKHL